MKKDIYKEIYNRMADDEKFYFENRLDDQIEWYDSKSMCSQNRYKTIKHVYIQKWCI